MSLLRVQDLAVRHDGEAVFAPSSASFTVEPGEVVLLLGPSGSGKSTLALTLNGLIPHDIEAEVRGSVTVDGMDAASTPVSRLATRVGMVFQDPDAQLVTGTVLDEVAFGPENLRLPVSQVLARSEDALRRVGLWERRDDSPDALSGGGRQRLAIAAALALGSPLLVLDEPTANLDPRGVDEVSATVGEIVAAGDRAVVLVEHNLDQAIGFVDRVVVMDASGRTIADGPAADILRSRAAELHELGVWLPTATLAALRMRRAGYVLEPLPLTPAELRVALESAPPVHPVVERAKRVETTPGPRFDSVAPLPRSTPGNSTPSVAPRAVQPRVETPEAVSVRHLTLRRGTTEVLHDVSLDIGAGEFVAVVGANGAGKTSLLQAIAGVVRPLRGSVLVGGVDVARARELTSRIGFVFQNPEHQFVTHTVRDELAYGLRHPTDDAADARVDDILRRFGLEDRADVHPFLLSGGQKRRLSVGTALVAGAPVLALDEPTFGQDRARADELLDLLTDLNRDGTTVIVVTHDMQLVAEHATRTIVLDDGRVLADGRTHAVFSDDALIERAGLRPPPLRAALRGLARHPELDGVVRLADLPGGDLLRRDLPEARS
ncbi:energy-coupling factor transporter ATPase [Microbacterium horticulturae]|uniref:Energy-coupling factor transporter ATPase n=1 Tax=Microbacterium horticulturae TaxID=3028316 RepID=A0ABY8C2P8_9MICO|nr:ABC transporter ATP-binding protein [Microbacterium sp. KACC 23027]WEG09118.1 energy-coupling factor transporter ATPase [Microbacterium sp. KACC 23027]